MSKNMVYCSLEEAWGPLFEKEDNTQLVPMPKNDNQKDLTMTSDRLLTESSTPIDRNMIDMYVKNKNLLNKSTSNELSDTIHCDAFLKHFLECKDCQGKIDDILNVGNDKKRNSVVEGFSNKFMEENYFDIFVLILVGIFIIFILDCFVRLGKNFKK